MKMFYLVEIQSQLLSQHYSNVKHWGYWALEKFYVEREVEEICNWGYWCSDQDCDQSWAELGIDLLRRMNILRCSGVLVEGVTGHYEDAGKWKKFGSTVTLVLPAMVDVRVPKKTKVRRKSCSAKPLAFCASHEWWLTVALGLAQVGISSHKQLWSSYYIVSFNFPCNCWLTSLFSSAAYES